MPISQAELGVRLRQARESAGLTQDQVGRELGISRSAVTLIENGTRAVSSLELDRLAFLFGRDIREFFAAEFGAENALVGLFRRNRDVADDPKSMTALRHCKAVGREPTNLERLVGIDRDPASAVRYNLSAPRSKFDAIRQRSAIAEQERRRLGIGDAAVADVTELLEKHGVRTAVVDLPKDISGLTVFEADHAKERHRFRHWFLSLALEAYGRAAISRGKLEELFATLLEKKREEVHLADFVANEPPTPVEIPS